MNLSCGIKGQNPFFLCPCSHRGISPDATGLALSNLCCWNLDPLRRRRTPAEKSISLQRGDNRRFEIWTRRTTNRTPEYQRSWISQTQRSAFSLPSFGSARQKNWERCNSCLFSQTGRTDVFNTTQKRFPSGPRVIEETHFSPNTALYHFMFRNSFHCLQRSMKADILQKTRAVKSGTRTPPRPVSHLSDRNRTKAYSGRRCFGGKDDGRLKVTTKEREKLRMNEWMKGILGNGVHK